MEVVVLRIHDTPAFGVGDPRASQVPFPRHGPIIDRRSARNLGDRQREILREDLERPPHAVAGQAAAERKESVDEVVHLAAELSEVMRGRNDARAHSTIFLA